MVVAPGISNIGPLNESPSEKEGKSGSRFTMTQQGLHPQ